MSQETCISRMTGGIEGQPTNQSEVLLVLPPLYQSGREPDYNPKEPMGLMYLAGKLRSEGRKVQIFDADIEAKTIEQTVETILDKNPPITGLSVFQRALPSFELVVNKLRDRGYTGHITCGGVTPTLSYPYILERLGDKVDSIVIGEGEDILSKLTSRVLSGQEWRDLPGVAYRENETVVVNKPIDVVDLDSLPFASRDYLDFCLGKTNYATLMGSRGCYGQCTFCSNYSFESNRRGPRWRGREPLSVVDEMQDIYESKGVNVFKFNDPNIFGPGQKGREHVRQMCREIEKREMKVHLMGFCRGDDITADPSIIPELKSAGFERLLIGIESSDNATLQLFRKGETIEGMEKSMDMLSEAGISTIAGFMIFNPYTTTETLKRDLSFLQRKGLNPTLSKALRVFDGTPIQMLMEKEGRLIKKNPFEGYHDYTMPEEVASIYGSMKILHSNCLDRIRIVGQDKIWNVKKAPSFRDRQDFNSLSDAFFGVESFLLKRLVDWTENPDWGWVQVDQVTKKVYEDLNKIGEFLGINVEEVIPKQPAVAEEIYTTMKEKTWYTFREEYRWNQD